MATYDDKTRAPQVSADTMRGIENPQVKRALEVGALEVDDSTVRSDFEKEKSLQAQVVQARDVERKQGRKLEKEELQEEKKELRKERRNYQAMQRKLATNKTFGKRKKGVKLARAKKMSGFARWGGVGIVATLYVWQFIFALLSLIAFGLHSSVVHFQTETSVGKFFGFFVDFQKYFPGEMLGGLGWIIASLLSYVVFLVYYYWYRFQGIDAGKTVISTLIFYTCMALSLFPVTNLFPWALLWVIYMNTASLFSHE